MTAKECFELLVTQIHVTALAAVNEDGLPVSGIADAVYADEAGLYFLTEKDGTLCKCLKSSAYAVCSGVKSEDPVNGTAVTVYGKISEAGTELLPQFFTAQKYLAEKYPDKKAFSVFCMTAGSGEWKTLSGKESGSFTFGAAEPEPAAEPQAGGYLVTDACIGCGACADACPQGCITVGDKAEIAQDECLQCGCCADTCPVGAIEQQ